MTPEEQDQARAIRVWMRRVMESRGWSARAWALAAGTSPTNITRFLKEGRNLPSTRTLAKLVRVAGSRPAFERARPAAVRAAPPRPAPRAAPEGLSDRAFAWRAARDEPMAGVAAGDLLWVEPVATIAPSEGCVALVGDGAGFRIGRVAAGAVLLSGERGASERLPLTAVVAVGVQLLRRLDLRRADAELWRQSGNDGFLMM